EWDFGTIQTIDPAGTESCRRVREGMRCWNQPVQWWLQHYVHQRMPPWHPTLRATGTMLVSAYWHGLHGGYYLSFLSVPLWLAAERAAEAALQRHWADGGGLLAAAPHWFLKMRVFEYLGVAFALRDAASTLRYWASIGFCLHLLPL
ncbi:MBOA7 acyltransferase, partial [Rhinopomastus cyanomelas]|nr:MBOA7 acyltransferase [Rhinopomastus cyanomelas]